MKQSADEIERECLAIRKEAGCKIDPETAEVLWNCGEVGDPYGTTRDTFWKKLADK